MHDIFSLCIIISIYNYIGVVCEPFLRGPTTPVCKSDSENLTFTCQDSQVKLLQWKTNRGFSNNNEVFFTVSTKNGTKVNVDNFTAILINNIVNITLQIANLTSTFTVPASRISNETVIICETISAGDILQSSFIELTTAGTVIQVLNHTASIIII